MAVKAVILSAEIIAFFEEEIIKHPKTETGGILLGYMEPTGLATVTHASGPGPAAKHHRKSITFDVEYCQSFVDQIYYQSSGDITYIGDWHFIRVQK